MYYKRQTKQKRENLVLVKLLLIVYYFRKKKYVKYVYFHFKIFEKNGEGDYD